MDTLSSSIGHVYCPIYIVRVFIKPVSCIPVYLSPLTCVYLTDILVSLIAEREFCRILLRGCFVLIFCLTVSV